MALLTNREALLAAWRALADTTGQQGWRFIPIATHAYCQLRAGRRLPGNEEALLAGFHLATSPAELPQGRGFALLVVDTDFAMEPAHLWFALARQPAGNLEMFTSMATDIVSTLEAASGFDQRVIFRLFLDRILAWQDFMGREHEGLLSLEVEIGLHGELILLAMLLDAGLEAPNAVKAWRGPLHGLHDFNTAAGAIEVKTTASEQGFPVKILSLQQLDPSLAEPLYLAGIHLSPDPKGLNLASRVEGIRQRLKHDSATLLAFSTLLLHAGYADAMADRYPRQFVHDRTRLLRVNDYFPNLVRSKIAPAITTVRYEIDLDRVECEDQRLTDILFH